MPTNPKIRPRQCYFCRREVAAKDAIRAVQGLNGMYLCAACNKEWPSLPSNVHAQNCKPRTIDTPKVPKLVLADVVEYDVWAAGRSRKTRNWNFIRTFHQRRKRWKELAS